MCLRLNAPCGQFHIRHFGKVGLSAWFVGRAWPSQTGSFPFLALLVDSNNTILFYVSYSEELETELCGSYYF